MRGTQGALIIASTIQIILGFSGLWRNVLKLVLLFSLHYHASFRFVVCYIEFLIFCPFLQIVKSIISCSFDLTCWIWTL
jgi:hypothetical protein